MTVWNMLGLTASLRVAADIAGLAQLGRRLTSKARGSSKVIDPQHFVWRTPRNARQELNPKQTQETHRDDIKIQNRKNES